MKTIETSDIFRSTYLLAQGGELDAIRVTRSGRPRATFVIRGEQADTWDRAYQCGQALVNPVQLRECLNQVRDVLFETLRDDERDDERREKNDRPGHHRRHQRRD